MTNVLNVLDLINLATLTEMTTINEQLNEVRAEKERREYQQNINKD
jgi:hypothetical protein